MTNFDLIAEAIERMNAGDTETAIARLKQFTALNTPKVKNGGKVKIYDWVSTWKYRPVFLGVFHDADNDVAVATDTHVLIVSKPDYDATFAGKIIGKKGDECEGRFPDYGRVIPKAGEEINVNRTRIAELLSEMRAEKKIDKTVDYLAFNISSNETPMYIEPKYCKLLLTLPEGKFYRCINRNDNSTVKYESQDGNYTAIIMPVCVKPELIGNEKIYVD